jgi:ATP-dependent Clp protease protease subunit
MTPGGPLDLATVLLGNRIIFIGQYINSQVAQRVISQLVTLSAIDEEGDILVSVLFFVTGASAFSFVTQIICFNVCSRPHIFLYVILHHSNYFFFFTRSILTVLVEVSIPS